MNLVHKTFVGHVMAYTGIGRNGRTDTPHKKATEFQLTIPLFLVKRILKNSILLYLHNRCKKSDKGCHTHNLITNVFKNLHFLFPRITASFLGHRPFNQHLKNFHCTSSQLFQFWRSEDPRTHLLSLDPG